MSDLLSSLAASLESCASTISANADPCPGSLVYGTDQEFVLAKDVFFLFGSQDMPLSYLNTFIDYLRRTGRGEDITAIRVSERGAST